MPSENIKAIFGSLPEIHDVHSRMAEELKNVIEEWSDTSSIGCVVIKYVSNNTSRLMKLVLLNNMMFNLGE